MTKLLGYLLILSFIVIAMEIFSYFALGINTVAIQSRTYRAPTAPQSDFKRYMAQRDPLLGWPTKEFMATHMDADGARLSPANQEFAKHQACVATYGDSFTYGAEVDDAHAWGNVLAAMLHCQVKNYGVGGYGVDQSVLRFSKHSRGATNIIILGVHIDDINRNMNQWRYLLSGSEKELFNFKPMFVVDHNNQLRLLTTPVSSYDDLLRTFERPSNVLKYDRYLPDRDPFRSQITVHFPYSWSLVHLIEKLVLEIEWHNLFLLTRLGDWNYPAWYDTPDGPSASKIALNAKIVELFAQMCKHKERHCVVLFIPDAEWIHMYETQGSIWTNAIINPMRQYADVWDPTEFLAAESRDEGICHYYGTNRDCEGHFNEDGYALLAHFVAATVWSRGLRPRPGG